MMKTTEKKMKNTTKMVFALIASSFSLGLEGGDETRIKKKGSKVGIF